MHNWRRWLKDPFIINCMQYIEKDEDQEKKGGEKRIYSNFRI
jgi:hypothetical protein